MIQTHHTSMFTYSRTQPKTSSTTSSPPTELSETNDTGYNTDSRCPSSSSKSSLQNDVAAAQADAHEAFKIIDRPQKETESEFDRIRNACPVLRSTACDEDFCQAGRMIKTKEPRVGQDRDASKIQEEASDFLQQLHRDGIIGTEEKLSARRDHALRELQQSSQLVQLSGRLPNEVEANSKGSPCNQSMLAGGVWWQEFEELEHGLRLAWQNSPKCIMRSESFSLQLCDLRHVTTSREMGSTLVDNMKKAYNNGTIAPTVCVFPARLPGQRGPMVWNGQLLSFAGYKDDDDTILGDPANVALTEAIIELGWQPPQLRTQWDLLPLVTMAEGDEPCITNISENDFPLVRIKHPDYELAFEKLGLRWVAAPALSQLGFDIGGVQYTATPFMGWFMDAEIGVRDLADSFRFNVLPKLVVALGWAEDESSFERAPEHERLAKLSKAQAELTYAVCHSYREAGVMMSDSLTASSMYCNFDDEHLREKGYRLPANPYWLAPPQGSIVPIWHRGGAPNYQPTPLICKHVQNPIKAWRREVQERSAQTSLQPRERHDSCWTDVSATGHAEANEQLRKEEPKSTVHIHYCTAANTARKLAGELHRRLSRTAGTTYHVQKPRTLNELRTNTLSRDDTVLIIASTTGHGEIPANGAKFAKDLQSSSDALVFNFMIFGNGSTLYHDTYNAAAKQIYDILQQNGARPLAGGLFEGDTAINDPPWERFERWVAEVERELCVSSETDRSRATPPETEMMTSSKFDIMAQYRPAKFMKCSGEKTSGILHVTLDVKDLHHDALSHVTIIPPNDEKDIKRALKVLRLSGCERLPDSVDMTTATFLRDFVDFDSPFTTLDWTDRLGLLASRKALFERLPLRDALQAMPRILTSSVFLRDVFAAMPLKVPRTYSTACCQDLLKSRGRGHQLELLVQSRHQGLMANFFKSASPGTALRIRHHESKWSALLEDGSRPVICFATGSGLAPIRSLLQHRLHLMREFYADNEEEVQPPGPITLILGFRPTDTNTIYSAIQEPIAAGVVDMCLLTPSNPAKVRAQDRIFEPGIREHMERKIGNEQASVLVCASSAAAEDFEANLNALIGCDVRTALDERYVKEVFLTRGAKPDLAV
ncbi:Nitric oxide synthase-like protein [Cercospora beticola]|uniref:nitric-oxide synthase (NADPH) n=1 Tax=Cercospora beticola TaxID=122368 RepID=A0A2G5HE18_CERBT|nr:Nitric oxide synthase-like protein [Cercospora beticola]PIA90769.1 Nitric oxide synthase-like protein [Cercospora beticola]WPB07736.1 hypothetical protein RHO25_012399 [Cercospora beticola]